MEQIGTLQLRGAFRLLLQDLEGNILEERIIKNTVVTQGRSWVLGQLNTVNQVTSQAISHIGVGSGSVAPTTGDTSLGNEVTRVAIGTWVTSTLTANPPSWQAQVLLATNVANTTISEVGIFNSNAGATMLARQTVASFVKATSNTLTISYTISG